MSLRSLLLVLAASTAAASIAPGSVAAQGPRPVTLHRAIALALAQNPDFQASHYDVQSARGALTQASVLMPNPSIFVGSLGRNFSPLDGPVPNQVGVNLSIPIGGQRAAGRDAARAALDSAHDSRESARQQLVLAVQQAFVAVLLAEAERDFVTQQRDRFRDSLQINELRYRDGKIAYGEVLKLRLQALAEDDQVRQANQALSDARTDLRQLVGNGALPYDYQVAGHLLAPDTSRAPDLRDVIHRALDHRPDYQAQLAARTSAEANGRLARRTPIPNIDVTFDYNIVPQDPGNYDALIGLDLPIFDHNQGAIVQADAATAQAGLAIESLRLAIRSDAVKAVREWNTARVHFASFEQRMRLAQQSLDISRRAYESGRGTLLDYLDAESSFLDVEVADREALARMMLADYQLRFLTGEAQ